MAGTRGRIVSVLAAAAVVKGVDSWPYCKVDAHAVDTADLRRGPRSFATARVLAEIAGALSKRAQA